MMRLERRVQRMSRTTFLTITGVIAFAVGCMALLLPAQLLEGKGVAPGHALMVWVREVGVLLVALGVTTFLVRKHPDSPTMRAFLTGNALLQIAIFPIEIMAFATGTITKLGGIVPNSILHLVLAFGFVHYARAVRPSDSVQ